MNSHSQTLPVNADAIRTATSRRLLFPICYFIAVAVAMTGWLWTIGWATFAFAKWLIA
jgi:hypothetical protein